MGSDRFGKGFAETHLSAAVTIEPLGLTLPAYGKDVLDNRHFTQVTPLCAFPNAALDGTARWGIEVAARY